MAVDSEERAKGDSERVGPMVRLFKAGVKRNNSSTLKGKRRFRF